MSDPLAYVAALRSPAGDYCEWIVGHLFGALEGDTLLVFTSDKGGERLSEMGPFSKGKMTLWEGGIRVAAATDPGERHDRKAARPEVLATLQHKYTAWEGEMLTPIALNASGEREP